MTRELWTIKDVAAHFGVGESYARDILSQAGVKSGYDPDAVRAIERPGQGRRTDLRQRGLRIVILRWAELSGWQRIDSRPVEPGDTVDLRGVAAEWLIDAKSWATWQGQPISITVHTPVRVELRQLHETFEWVETYAPCMACVADHAPILAPVPQGPPSMPHRTLDPAQVLTEEEMVAARSRLREHSA